MEKQYTQEEAQEILDSARQVSKAFNVLLAKLGITDSAGFILPAFNDTKLIESYYEFIKWDNSLLTKTPKGSYVPSTTIKF